MNSYRTIVGLGFALSLALAGPAFADNDRRPLPEPDAKLYEVVENVQFDPRDGVLHRSAVATLMGVVKLGTPLCPNEALLTNPDAKTCTVIGVGNDSVSLATGQSKVWGTYAVVVNAPGNSSVHVPDLPLMTGTFSGDIDLSPAIHYGTPIGFLRNGTFTIDQTGSALPFSGTFRLPFSLDKQGRVKKHDDRDESAYYLADDGSLVRVRSHERSIGFAAVRLDITFGQ